MQQHPPPQRPTFCNSNSFDQQRRQQQQQSSYSTMIPRDTTTSAAQHRSSSHFGTMTTLTAPTQDHPCIDYYVEPKRHDGSSDYHSQNHDAHQGRNNHRNEYQQVNRGQEDQRDPYNTMRRRYGNHENEGKYNDNTRDLQQQQQQQQNKTMFGKFQPYLHLFGVTMIGMFAYYVWTVVIPYLFQVVFPMVFNLLCISFACSIVACMGWLLYSRTATTSATTSATGWTSALASPVASPPPTTAKVKSERRATKSKRKDREVARKNARCTISALREDQQKKSKDSRGEQRPIPPDVSGLTQAEEQRVYQEYWFDNMKYLG